MKEKDLDERLDSLIDLLKGTVKGVINDTLEENKNEPVKISIEKDKKGKATVNVEGKPVDILMTLARLEKSILEEIDPPAGFYEMIKEKIGIQGAED